MYTLGFDVGTKFGWALFADDNLVDSGVLKLRKKQGIARRMELHDKLHKLLEEDLAGLCSDCVQAAVEEIQFAKFRLAYASYNLNLAVLELVLGYKEIPLSYCGASTLKKSATGSGHASKRDMIDTANKKYGAGLPFTKVAEDEADAIHVAAWLALNPNKKEKNVKKTTRKHRSSSKPRVWTRAKSGRPRRRKST